MCYVTLFVLGCEPPGQLSPPCCQSAFMGFLWFPSTVKIMQNRFFDHSSLTVDVDMRVWLSVSLCV